MFPIPIIGFAAYSGTGKTTLIEQLIPMLVKEGIRVALVKHSHHDIEMDTPGKDSYRLRKAGATQVVLAGPKRSICFHEQQPQHDHSLVSQLSLLDTNSLDLVIVEGYRDQPFPKIELHRRELAKPFLFPTDVNIIALVCDAAVSDCLLPQFHYQQLSALISFIKARFLNNEVD